MTVEFTGQDLAEAIAAAAEALDLPPEKLKFNLLEMGTKGFLGLGRRRARIAVDPADPVLDLSEDEAPGAPEGLPEPSAAPVPEPGRPEPEPPASSPEAATPVPAPGAQPPKSPKPGREAPRDSKPRVSQPLELPLPLTRPAPGEIRVDDPDDETARLARTVVTDILSRLGLTADLTMVRLGSRLVVNLDGPDRAILIGARGATLEALSLLTAKIMSKKGSGEGGRLVLDVADYRFRRHNQVMENLRLQAEAARRTGRPQPLTGLSSAERRLVRLAIRPVEDLELKAGRGPEGLVLVPIAPAPGAAGAGRRRRKPKGEPK